MRAVVAAADNETSGTNGSKSAPIINPHSFHWSQLLNYEDFFANLSTHSFLPFLP